MTMTPGLRKLALTVHISCSVGWLGAVASFLVLALVGITRRDAQAVRGAYLAMDVITSAVIVPLSVGSLLSGLVLSLGTSWGLVRHYWVLIKFLVTSIATVVLLLQVDSIQYVADIASRTTFSGSDLGEARASLVVHAAGGLLVLLVPMVLSVYKPSGRTPFDRRTQRPPQPASRPSSGTYEATW